MDDAASRSARRTASARTSGSRPGSSTATSSAPRATFDFWKAVGPVTRAKGYKSRRRDHQRPDRAAGRARRRDLLVLDDAVQRRAAGRLRDGRPAQPLLLHRPLPARSRRDRVHQRLGLQADDVVHQRHRLSACSSAATATATAARGYVRFEIYSVPTGRTVSHRDRPAPEPPLRDGHRPVHVEPLARRAKRIEYPVNGFKVSATRTVRDRDGKVIHRDTYFSNYATITGVDARRSLTRPDGRLRPARSPRRPRRHPAPARRHPLRAAARWPRRRSRPRRGSHRRPHPARPGRIRRRELAHRHRQPDRPDRAERRMLVLGQHRAVTQLIDVQGLFQRAHRGDGHPAAEALEPFGRRPLGEPDLEDVEQLGPVPAARLEVDESRIRDELSEVHRLGQRPEELLLGTGHGDVAVGGGEELERHDARVRRTSRGAA